MKRTRSSNAVAELLGGISDPARLRLLRVLEAEELSVGELARVVQLPQSTVSRHLKILGDGGWLARRSAGTATLYRLIMDDLSPASRPLWLAVRGQLGDSLDVDEDDRRLRAVLAERRLDSQAFFGRVAGEWDEVRTRLFGADFTARALLAMMPRRWVVADLGCGTGNATELLAEHVERVIAVDQSEAMLDAARKRLDGFRNVELLSGGLERLPLADTSVDAAVSILVLHHVAEPLSALREMRRVLRAERGGGAALLVDMLAHDREEFRHTMGHTHMGFAPLTVRALLRDAGFKDVTFTELHSDAEAKGPGLFAAVGRI